MSHPTTTPIIYVVHPEYREAWGSPEPGTSFDMHDIARLSETWGIPVETLLQQVQPARFYRASDGCGSWDYEAACMEDAVRFARDAWENASSGTYEVTIYEHLDIEDRDEMYCAGATRPTATETITVTINE